MSKRTYQVTRIFTCEIEIDGSDTGCGCDACIEACGENAALEIARDIGEFKLEHEEVEEI